MNQGVTSHATYLDPLIKFSSRLTSDLSVVHSDQYFRLGYPLVGVMFPSKSAFTLPQFQKKCTHHLAYMPIFNPFKLKCESYPGVLLSEGQSLANIENVERNIHSLDLLPMIRCIILKENCDRVVMDGCELCSEEISATKCKASQDKNQIQIINFKDARNVMSRIKSSTVEVRNCKKIGRASCRERV